MTELLLMQAALFQLRAAIDSISDPFTRTAVKLAGDVFAGALASAAEGPLNASKVSDLEFALSDVVGAAADLSADDAALVQPALDMLQRDLETLKKQTALPEDLINGLRALQTKLKARRAAIERQTYAEGGGGALPHAPSELRAEALPLRDRLAAAGFSTPALDEFLGDPDALRFHSITSIVDELDVIVG